MRNPFFYFLILLGVVLVVQGVTSVFKKRFRLYYSESSKVAWETTGRTAVAMGALYIVAGLAAILVSVLWPGVTL